MVDRKEERLSRASGRLEKTFNKEENYEAHYFFESSVNGEQKVSCNTEEEFLKATADYIKDKDNINEIKNLEGEDLEALVITEQCTDGVNVEGVYQVDLESLYKWAVINDLSQTLPKDGYHVVEDVGADYRRIVPNDGVNHCLGYENYEEPRPGKDKPPVYNSIEEAKQNFPDADANPKLEAKEQKQKLSTDLGGDASTKNTLDEIKANGDPLKPPSNEQPLNSPKV